ncbi:MAG: tetratricopeptide repeat protein [Anaerolineae bacterium]
MTDSGPTLVRSKLLLPSPAGLLHRPQVFERIEAGLERQLTLVSAPAGYGKTSALVDFAHHTSVPVSWYTTDERDRDLSLFVRYVVGAISVQFPSFGARTRATLASKERDLFREPTSVVADLVNEMLDLPGDFVLVLDNFEAVDGAFGIREFVHRLLDVLPDNCHLMMGSRVLPDVPVTRLVARRQLVGLTEQDLRFEPREIRELLLRSQIEVSESQAEAIAASAEGWVTGILLISDLLGQDAQSVFVGTEKATAKAYDYLAAEVLSRQPSNIQRFLRTSSVLRDMSSRLCRGILEIDGAYALLAEVERRNLFVTRFGEAVGATYRYHNLFRNFLQEQLQQREPGRYARLHRRAGAWFEQEHDVGESVYHYLSAEAYPEATALMERVAMERFTRGRQEALMLWASELPGEVRDRAPRLFLYQSKVLTDRYLFDEARQALAHAESGFAARGDQTRLAKVHIQRATLSLLEGQHQVAISEADEALNLLGREEPAEKAQAQRLIGAALVELGDYPAGTTRLEEALQLYREVGSPYDVVNLLRDLTYASASQGAFDKAAAYLNEALPLARRLESASQLAGVLNNLGMLYYVRGDYQEALTLYREGMVEARRGGDARGQANLAEGMATIYRDLGIYQRAELLYDTAWQIACNSRPSQAVLIMVARAHMYRWQDDHQQAQALLEEARQVARENGLDVETHGLVRMAEGITLARPLLPGEGLLGCRWEARGCRRAAQGTGSRGGDWRRPVCRHRGPARACVAQPGSRQGVDKVP